MIKPNVTVRAAASREELVEVGELQRESFGFSATEIVSANELTTFQKNGGVALVAVNDFDSKMLGFLFGFSSIYEDQPCHHTVMFGVLPEYRLNGIGYQLLLEQQKYVNNQGVEIITAFVDPLESIPLSLCIRKMHGKAHQYFRNLFGSGLGGISSGLDTDRLRIEWQSNYSNVAGDQPVAPYDITDMQNAGAVVNNTQSRQGFREITDFKLNLSHPYLFVEIPDDFQTIKTTDSSLAVNWRNGMREILENYLRNYSVVDFRSEYKPARRNYLVLEKNKTTRKRTV